MKERSRPGRLLLPVVALVALIGIAGCSPRPAPQPVPSPPPAAQAR